MYETEKKYREVASCPVSSIKQIVISKNSDDNIVMAKRVIVNDEDGTKMFFEKGATIIKQEYKEDFKKFLQTVLKSLE